MKRLYSVLACVVLVAISSCSVREDLTVEASHLPIFYGTFEPMNGAQETKAYIDDKNNLSFWNDGDFVSIFYDNTRNNKYTYVGFDGTVSGRFDPIAEDDFGVGEDITPDGNYAIYPYNDYNACQRDGTLIVPFPKEQVYCNPDGLGVYPILVAKSTTKQLPFKHVAGYLGFQLYGSGVTVSSITLQSRGGEPLSGAPEIAFDESGNPVLNFVGRKTDDPSCTVFYDPAIDLGASSDASKLFWITLPPTALSQGITLIVKDVNGGVFTKESELDEIVRNQTQRFSPIEVKPEIQIVPVESVSVTPVTLEMTVGDADASLTATVSPSNATDKRVTWSSDNEKVAKVDSEGKVTAVAPGAATITVTTVDGSKTATCEVTVNNPDVYTYGLALSADKEEINVGEELTYSVSLITFKNDVKESETAINDASLSCDEEFATFVSGYKVKGKKQGDATITATYIPEGAVDAVTATATLSVKDVVTYTLAIEPAESAVVYVGKTLPFTLTLTTTTNGTAVKSDVTDAATWSSSNTDAATIAAGVATGKKDRSTTTITAKYTPDGSSEELSVSVELTVNKDPNTPDNPIPVEEEEEV